MSVIRLIIFVVAIGSVFTCYGRRINSSRGKLQLKKQEVVTPAAKADTIYDDFDSVSVAGFEKAQNSSTESFFIKNKSRHYIKGINLSIDYVNLKGEQLHLETHTISCDIPPMQTRALQTKSWDRQHLWYYVGTQGRHNDYCNPFDVRIRINYLITDPDR